MNDAADDMPLPPPPAEEPPRKSLWPLLWAALAWVVIVGFVACFGCNPGLLPFFLQGESREAPTVKRLALEDKKKEVKVAVVVSSRLDARSARQHDPA